MSREYGTYGLIPPNITDGLLAEFPLFAEMMRNRFINVYDDDLKMFLVTTLSKIDYLKEIALNEPNIIVHLAYSMEANILTKEEHLFEADQAGVDELVIIFDGMIEVYTEMDNKTEFCIDHLPKGSILNANSFLVNR